MRGPLTLCLTSTAQVKQLPFWRSAAPSHNDDYLTLRLRLLSCCPLEWDMQLPAAYQVPTLPYAGSSLSARVRST